MDFSFHISSKALTEVIEQPATVISNFFLEAFGTPFICVYCVYLQRVNIKRHESGRLHSKKGNNYILATEKNCYLCTKII